MDYFSEPNQTYHRRPRYLPLVAVALISAILGSMLSLAVGVKYFNPSQTPGAGSKATTAIPTSSPKQVANIEPAASSFQAVNIAKAVGPAVVGVANFQSVNSYRGNGLFGGGGSSGGGGLQEVGSGSGIVIDANKGYIVTNNHVIDGASKIVVTLANNKSVDGKLVGADPRTDLAVIQVTDTKGLVAAPIGDSNTLEVGEPVVAIGNPGGQQFARSLTEGVISALNRVLQLSGEASFNLIQTDAAINPGNSGGALVDWQGKVIGINSAKNQEPGFEGMGFAIPISDAMPIINQLIQTGHASHAGIWVSIDQNYNAEYAQARGWPAGALVTDVSANGPAAKAGMQPGDIITQVNGAAVSDYYDLTHELFKYKAGDSVKLVVARNGKQVNLQVTLAELPQGQ